LPSWLHSRIRFVEGVEDDFVLLHTLWTSLRVSGAVVDVLVDMRLRWRGGALEISRAWAEQAGDTFLEHVTGALLYLWRFRKHCDSRWTTVGETCRTLAASLLSGVGDLASMLLEDRAVSKYHLGGFARLSERLRRFVVTAAYAASVPDALLAELFEDDRVAGRADELQAVVTDELHWLVNLPEDLWKELSFLVAPDASSSALRSGTLTAALISGAFAERRIFREATSLPWSLCQGDIRANLRNLGGMPDQAPRGTVISLTDIVFLVRWRSGLSSLGLVFYGGPHLLRGGRRGVCPGLLQMIFAGELLTLAALQHVLLGVHRLIGFRRKSLSFFFVITALPGRQRSPRGRSKSS
jgi:hypothetical protein